MQGFKDMARKHIAAGNPHLAEQLLSKVGLSVEGLGYVTLRPTVKAFSDQAEAEYRNRRSQAISNIATQGGMTTAKATRIFDGTEASELPTMSQQFEKRGTSDAEWLRQEINGKFSFDKFRPFE